MIEKTLIFLFTLVLTMSSSECEKLKEDLIDLAVECNKEVECGSITLGGTTATYPLYFNINNDDGEQCYYRPDNQGALGQPITVSNDKCDCDCVRWYEGD